MGSFEQLLQALPIPTLVLGEAGRIVYANLAALHLLAWKALEGQPLTAIVPARLHVIEGQPLVAYLAERARRTGERPLRMPAMRRDGLEIEVECSTANVPSDHGEELTLLSLQQRPASVDFEVDRIGIGEQESAHEQQQRYRLVFEHAPLGIFHFDARGVITACNDVFVGIIGSSRRLLIGLDLRTLPDPRVRACTRAALAGERGGFEGDYYSAAADKVTPVRADFAPIRTGGVVIGGLGLVEDITERKRAEEELRALVDREQEARRAAEQAAKAREDFLLVASHELRTPMTSLLLAVESLQAVASKGGLAHAPESMVRRVLATTMRQTRHLVRLIDELLDVSRIRAGRLELHLEEADLDQVVRTVATRLEAQSTTAGCPVRLDTQPARGRFDPARIERVVTNLLANAIKFGAGKPIDLEVRADADTLTLRVRDRGIGIAPEEQTRIFDRFERAVSVRHYGGLGLGLSIVKSVVEAHGGTVSVESEPTKGATFTIRLPRRGP